jgi:hypothetical protein
MISAAGKKNLNHRGTEAQRVLLYSMKISVPPCLCGKNLCGFAAKAEAGHD